MIARSLSPPRRAGRAPRGAPAWLPALLLAAIALAGGAGPACAQGDVALRWNACDSLGDVSFMSQCTFNEGETRLVMSLTPQTDVTQVVGWALVVDIGSLVNPLPLWWQVQPGGCRQSQFVAVAPNGTEGACTDAWSAAGAALVQSLIYPRPGGDASQLRVIISVAVPAASAFTLVHGQSYLAAVMGLHYANTAGALACAGCSTPACFVFNSAEITRLPGAQGTPPQPFVTPSPGVGNQALWNTGASCAPVPVRNRTWGQIKAIYR